MGFDLGIPELLLILFIVLLLFGPGRLSKIAGELGKSIKNFKDGISNDKEDQVEPSKTDKKEE